MSDIQASFMELNKVALQLHEKVWPTFDAELAALNEYVDLQMEELGYVLVGSCALSMINFYGTMVSKELMKEELARERIVYGITKWVDACLPKFIEKEKKNEPPS